MDSLSYFYAFFRPTEDELLKLPLPCRGHELVGLASAYTTENLRALEYMRSKSAPGVPSCPFWSPEARNFLVPWAMLYISLLVLLAFCGALRDCRRKVPSYLRTLNLRTVAFTSTI